MERRVAIWGTIPKGDNEWFPVFKLKGDKHLEALRYQFKSMAPTKYVDIQVERMFEKFEHKWRDAKTRKPHEISTLLNIDEYLSFLEKDKFLGRRFSTLVTLRSRCAEEASICLELQEQILDQLLTWACRGSMFKKGHTCLMPMYINIPQQPNEYDCAIFVMKWMEELDPTILKDCHAGTREHNIPPWNSAQLEKFKEKIVSNILLSPKNLMRMDVVTEVNEIRLIKPGAALRSPFTQLYSADLKTN
ncbi:hypothetical protein PIB30_041326 [Stylosanthes scabra]|uniref:Ubiquitin-like protease family profile domain-containing protein n=1 Tax=Stylosanthes scabra TaxID=79078 RepID=A0ABU6VDY5_9FABA|nr:hypothetical protein [Stylosanthes scabra]